jgi:hypothetical protein
MDKSVRCPFVFICFLISGFAAFSPTARATSVVTYHFDTGNGGANTSETSLTPANVNTGSFAKRFSTSVDGKVYAQPLYMPAVVVSGGANAGTHDLAFVATQHDSLYAIDADSGIVVWKTSFTASGLPGATITSMPSSDTNSSDTSPEIGICGTPTIDPSTNYLYLAAKTKQVVSGVVHYVYTLYKVDITNGNATANANILASTIIGDTVYDSSSQTYTYHTANSPTAAQDIFVPGTGDGTITVNGQSRVYFNAMRQMNRPAMLLTGGMLYIAFGSHGDNGPYHGWLLAYSASSLALEGVLNATPNASEGGFWGGGAAPSVDSQGYVYLMTGNGTFDGSSNNGTTIGLNSSGFPASGDYGDSFLKITTDSSTSVGNQNVNGWGLKIVDYFAPFNCQSLDDSDTDLGSGGVTILPNSAGSSAHPHLLVGAGKQGNLYLIDRDNMGKFSATTDNVVQSQTAINECFNTETFFNGVLYCASVTDALKSFTISNASMSTSPVRSSDGFDWPGATLAVSANGTSNGIVWGIDNGTSDLRAYDATDVTNEFWNSGQAANNSDSLGTAQKFAAPAVADGHVFVPTSNSLVVYGLTPTATSAPAAPSNLTASAVSGLQINLSWTDNSSNENGFAIEQSTDGVNFTQISTVGVNMTSYAANTNLSVGTTYYFRVRAFNGSSNNNFSDYSNVANATTSGSPPSLSYSSGFAGSSGALVYNGNAKIVNNRAELTDGGSNENSTVFSASAQNIQRFSTQFTFQLSSASGEGFTFIIQNGAPTALGNGGGDLGFGGLNNSVAIKFDIVSDNGEGNDSTGLYTNGSDPYSPDTDLSGNNIQLASGDVMQVQLTYDGTTLTETITDTVTNATQTLTYTVNIPSIVGGNTAYVGFGGSTSSLTAVQDILTWTFAPLPTSAPAAPSKLSATAVSGTQINLSWTDNSTNEAGFIVMRSTSGGGYVQIGVTGTGVTTYSDSALTPDTNYSYKVQATNSVGNSAFSNVATALTPIPPPTPTGAHATAITSTSIAMAWTDNANNETGYNILRKMTTGANFAQIASLPANSTSFSDTGLTPGTSYDYHIQAYNVAGYSDFSGFTAITSTASAPPNGTTPVVYLAASGAQVSSSVNPKGVTTSIYIQYGTSTNYGSQTATITLGRGESALSVLLLLPDLTANTPYHFRFVTMTGANTVDSGDQTFTTLPFDTTLIAEKSGQIAATPGATYSSFGNPAINNGGNSAFRAVLARGGSVTAANDIGIWADDNSGTPQLVARTGSGAAPGAGTSTFTALDDPVYNNNNAVAFVGTLSVVSGGATRSSTTGVWSNSGGSLASVAREGTQAPDLPSGVNFASFSQIALPDANGPILFATLTQNTSLGIGRSNDVGIWAADSTDTLHLVVRTGDTLNGKTITTLAFMPVAAAPVSGQTRGFVPSSSDITYLATFSDRTTGIFDVASGSTTEVASSASSAPGTSANFASFGNPAISSGRHNAFRGVLASGSGVTTTNDVGIWADDSSNTLQLVTRTGTGIAPGTTAPFTALSDPVYNDNDEVAFKGTLKVGTGLASLGTNTGIWAYSNGGLEAVALEGNQAPGCPAGANFASFTQIALADQNGAMFLATLTAKTSAGVGRSSDLGIWATDSSGDLQLIVRTGDILNGKTVTGLAFLTSTSTSHVSGQSRSFAPNSGNLTYLATFSDRTTGIYSVIFP